MVRVCESNIIFHFGVLPSAHHAIFSQTTLRNFTKLGGGGGGVGLGGWLGEAEGSYRFCHRGAQLILAYSWARPAVLAAGKGREGMLLFLLFLHFLSFPFFRPIPHPSLSSPLLSLLSVFFLSLGDDTK